MDRFTSFKAPADEEKGFFSRYEIQLFDYRIHSPSPLRISSSLDEGSNRSSFNSVTKWKLRFRKSAMFGVID